MSSASNRQLDLSERFDRLTQEWEQATMLMSSVPQICMNRSYQRIIGLGAAAVPLILERLERRPGHWFWALEAITGENPVAPEHMGHMAAMAADWIAWGRDHQLIPA